MPAKIFKMNTLRASKKVKLSEKISMQQIQHRKIKTMKLKIIFLVPSDRNLTKMKQIWKGGATVRITYSQTRLNSKCTKLKDKNRQNNSKTASIKEHHQYDNVHCDDYSKYLHYEGNTKEFVQRLSEKVDFHIFWRSKFHLVNIKTSSQIKTDQIDPRIDDFNMIRKCYS